MAAARSLFATVPDRDSLGFWDGPKLKARAVVDFLGFDKREVAAIAGVAPASVRFDHKMPREVLDRLEEIACLCGLSRGPPAGSRPATRCSEIWRRAT